MGKKHKSKKSNKHKKSRKHSSKKRRARSNSSTSTRSSSSNAGSTKQLNLHEILEKIFEKHPTISRQILQLLSTLDAGESVRLDGFSDEAFKQNIELLLTALGAKKLKTDKKSFSFEYSSEKNEISAVEKLFFALNESGKFIPNNPKEALAKISAVVDEFSKIEGMEMIGQELPDILRNVLEGELIVLDDLPDFRLKDFLAKIFNILGFKKEDSSKGEGSNKEVYGMMTVNENISDIKGKIFALRLNVCIESIKLAIEFYKGADENSPSPRNNNEEIEQKKMVGPCKPSQQLLEKAANMKEAFGKAGESSEDELVGPSLVPRERPPLPSTNEETSSLWTQSPFEGGKKREEWMTVPPKSLGVLGALRPTNRKFKKSSSKSKDEAPKIKSKEEIEEEAKMEQIMDAYRKHRGPSLADIHASKSKEEIRKEKRLREIEESKKDDKYGDPTLSRKFGKRKVGAEAGGFSWDRDEVMDVQHKRKTPIQYKEMLNSSRNLDSKFSKSITKNFM